MRRRIFITIVYIFSIALFYSCTQKENIIKVAVFNGNGASPICVIETKEALLIDSDISVSEISSSEIMKGCLANFDVLVFPGGSGSKELNNLGDQGKEIVRNFLTKNGKGIIGICAGSFLLSKTEGYPSLQLGNVRVIDRVHYARGKGLIEFELTNEGKKIFPELVGRKAYCQYYDGPILGQIKEKENFKAIGKYVTDIHPNKGAPKNVTPKKLFLYNEKIGEGKLFAISGHPESTPGMRWMLPRMVRWVSNQKMVSYTPSVVRPDIYNQVVLFDQKQKRVEKKYWWQLFHPSPDSIIIAMEQLHFMHSRPAVRWNMGLLRSKHAEVRLKAVELLFDSEYTAALPDIKDIFELEENALNKEKMSEIIKKMNRIKNN
ncbi:MAG: DJ-1/PfpI family protein [Bacteroidales bacterium]|nr:DJ-1/PfpI family protein [Bacteroidales bacterium]